MNIRSMALGCVFGAVASLSVGYAFAQDGGLLDFAQSPEAATRATSTGPQHEFLEQSVGTWDITYKIYMAGPDGPAMEAKGTTTIESVLDGRFLLERSSTVFNLPNETGEMGPVPIDGIGMTGYDRHRRIFVGSWADSMNTHLLTMRGSLSADGKTLTMYGEMDEPGLGITGRMVRYQTEMIDEDHRMFTVYDLCVSDDHKVLTIEYARK